MTSASGEAVHATTDQLFNLTREQVRRIDELSQSRYGIPALLLMENAGRSASEIIRREYGGCHVARVYCGGGNNGGDGFVIARHLHNAGWAVHVLSPTRPERMTAEARLNFHIAEAMGLVETEADPGDKHSAFTSRDVLIIDALLGTGFSGLVRSPLIESIEAINRAVHCPVVAVDVPSGLNCDTGLPSNATVRATLTITFVGLKRGFLESAAKAYVGEVRVGDIGAPVELIREIASRSKS